MVIEISEASGFSYTTGPDTGEVGVAALLCDSEKGSAEGAPRVAGRRTPFLADRECAGGDPLLETGGEGVALVEAFAGPLVEWGASGTMGAGGGDLCRRFGSVDTSAGGGLRVAAMLLLSTAGVTSA